MIIANPTEWVRTILCIGHPEDMLALESRYLTTLGAAADPMSYNMHDGDGKFTTAGLPAWNRGKPGKKGVVPWNKGLTKANNAILAAAGKKKLGHIAHNKGVPMSAEQRLQKSIAMKGRPSPNKGKLGRVHTPEELEKMSAAKKGKTQSPEHIAAKAAARRGKKNPNPSPMKGVPKVKTISRIFDRKEMTLSNFNTWLKTAKGA